MSKLMRIKSNDQASSSTTPSPFAHLPDLCLLALFRQLPPADQLSALVVCHRWSALIPVVNQPHTRSLTIIFKRPLDIAEDRLNSLSHGPHWKLLKLLKNKENGSPLFPIQPLTKWNSLQLDMILNRKTISQIVATFPVVKELQLFATAASTNTSHDLIDRLLKQWRPYLTKLKLDIPNAKHFSSQQLVHLTATINTLPTLKHLSINMNQSFFPNLNQLTQLTDFHTTFCLLLPTDDIINSSLVHISLGYLCNEITSLRSNLCQRIVRLDHVSHVNYRHICQHLSSLTSIHILLTDVHRTFPDFLAHTSQLTVLVHLKLSLHFPTSHPDDDQLPPHHLLPQLKSIKLLQLALTLPSSHHDLVKLNIPWTIPNVQVIKLSIASPRCTICGITKQSVRDENKAKHCLRQMFAHLKHGCLQLHTILHNRENDLGTAEELLLG